MNWIEQTKQEMRNLRSYSEELEAKLRCAEGALSELAAGLYNSNVTQGSWTHSTKLQVSASHALMKLSQMPMRRKPNTRY